jgi:hypothetical protein
MKSATLVSASNRVSYHCDRGYGLSSSNAGSRVFLETLYGECSK